MKPAQRELSAFRWSAFITTVLLFVSGCSQPLTEVKTETVQPKPVSPSKVSLDLNQQDVDQVASSEISHLFGSGILNSATGSPTVLILQLHHSSDALDAAADQVLGKIRAALLQSGKVVFNDSATAAPDSVHGILSGHFTKTAPENQSSPQVNYDFYLDLKSPSGDVTRWADQLTIAKVSHRSATGW